LYVYAGGLGERQLAYGPPWSKHLAISAPTENKPSTSPGFFASLAYPDYRRLWTATGFTQSAGWALIVARGPLAYQVTDSATWIGLITFAALIPSLAFNPIGGYLADRMDRRHLLMACCATNLVTALALAVAVVMGVIHGPGGIWWLLGLSVINGCARSVQMPASQSLLPNLIPREGLLNGIALNQAVQQGSRAAGALAMVPLVATVDTEWIFFIPVALYFLGGIQLASIKTRSTGEKVAGRGVFYNLVAGIHYSYTHPIVLSVIMLAVAHCALTMAFEALFPLFAREQLGMSEDRALYSGPMYMMIGVGIGAVFVNTVVLARVRDQRKRGGLIFWLGILSGLSPLALAFSDSLLLAVLAAAAIGGATAGFMTMTHSTIQQIIPDGLRGRISSVNMWHTMGMMAAFNLVNPALADLSWIDAPRILAATGLIFLVIVLISLLIPPLRQIYMRGLPESVQGELRPSFAAAG
jgi:MFS family permease